LLGENRMMSSPLRLLSLSKPESRFHRLTSRLAALVVAATAAIPLALPSAAQAQASAAGTASAALTYKSVREGTGASPTATDSVRVHYRGTLMDGTEFDSSYKRGQPATFPLNRVIPCWTQGVQRMKVGGKAELVCPPGLAYGERGAGGTIPPNATLRFEIELLEVNPR